MLPLERGCAGVGSPFAWLRTCFGLTLRNGHTGRSFKPWVRFVGIYSSDEKVPVHQKAHMGSGPHCCSGVHRHSEARVKSCRQLSRQNI